MINELYNKSFQIYVTLTHISPVIESAISWPYSLLSENHYRDDGYIEHRGRTKDVIIRGGENIYPAEVEALLRQFSGVEDAQVIGVPSERLGEEVAAFIKLNQLNFNEDSIKEVEKKIKQYCKENITYFKIPKYFKFVNEYPTTVTGKVQKFKLREIAKETLLK